jgi:hypothetical protein
MTPELQQLVRDTMQLTGAAAPDLMVDGGATLVDAVLTEAAGDGDGFYLVGFIGGKDVGKSALVNAMAGRPITVSSNFGEGTDSVTAYAHESQAGAVTELLQREAPGQFRLVTHRLPSLARQVLLDLPDIDSHWAGHVELTKRMLRHMLFPLWVQSVEKYADRQPQELLRQVAAGNAAANFLFCVNKVDQLDRMSGGDPHAPEELREDFAERIGRTLKIPPPRVWLLSATKPDAFDLPALQKQLGQQRSEAEVKQGMALARQQQDRSLGAWLAAQDLPGRAQRLARLQEEAEELLADRVGTPLIERSLPALADDASSRLALTDEVLAARAARWPVVNLVQAVLTPVLVVVRRNVGVTRVAALPDAEAIVDAHLRPAGVPVATLVQNTFAQLQQTHPQVSDLYAGRRLWEQMSAEAAATSLRTALTDTVARQRAEVRRRLGGSGGGLFAPLRWLLTIGAVVWFPFVQPAIDRLSGADGFNRYVTHDAHVLVDLAIHIISVADLLQSLTFLLMYFGLLWAILRWDTGRRVSKWSSRWRADQASDLSLTAQTVRWLDGLLQPIRTARERAEALAARAAAADTEERQRPAA